VGVIASFAPIDYKITATAGAGGSIDPAGDTSVTVLSAPQLFTIDADAGYKIAAVLVNGLAAVPAVPADATSYSYTFATGITSNQTIDATFETIDYKITATAGAGGSIDPAGDTSVTVLSAPQLFTIDADAGYKIAAVLVNGLAAVPAVPADATSYSYTFATGITSNQTIDATFETIDYKITATAGAGGSIDPAGDTSVTVLSAPQLFTIDADAGYKIAAVLVNGLAAVPAVPADATSYSYTFATGITSNQTIDATFETIDYKITATAGAGGSIDPAGDTSVTVLSAPQLFTIDADAGYKIAAVLVNGLAAVPAVPADATSYSYTFATGITSNQTIDATFETIDYKITATAGAGGSIDPAGDTSVTVLSAPQLFTIDADAGYKIAAVLVNGLAAVPAVPADATSYSYTFATGITSNQTIDATFETIDYKITATAGAGGSIDPAGDTSVTVLSAPQLFTIDADAGYKIAAVLVNGLAAVPAVPADATSYSYTFATGITSNQTIDATFETIDYKITATAGAGGSIDPAGDTSVTVLSAPQLFTIDADAGYKIAAVLVNGLAAVPAVPADATSYSYTFATGITSNQTIDATFETIDYKITATAGAGGSIDPAGDTSVTVLSAPQLFTIDADAGYKIAAVLVNGLAAVPAVPADATSYSYTFATGITSNQTIDATFETIDYKITATAGAGGSIDPAGDTSVTVLSAPQLFTIDADAGYKIAAVLVNGLAAVPAVPADATSYSYTFATGITSNQTIDATFETIDYKITATAGAGGSIDPAGDTSVTVLSAPQLFTIDADAGYKIAAVLVNGLAAVPAVPADATSYSYTFATGITSNQTIDATFETIDYKITATAGAGGSIDPAGDTSVTVLSAPQLFTIDADAGYKIAAVLVNGLAAVPAVPADATSYSYTFATGITSNQTITASFVLIDYTLTVNQVGGFGTGVLTIVPSQAVYHVGEVVTISASPGIGEKFINWSGDGADIGGSPPDRQVTFDGSGNKTVTANFDFIDYTLTVTSAGGTGGAADRVSVSAPGPYHYNDVVTLTANPQAGETFSGWGGDLAGSTNPEAITINGDKTVTANFEKIPVALTMQVVIMDGGAFGTVSPDIGTYSYLWGDTIAVSATPNPNSAFSGWSPNVVGGVVTMNGDQTVTATFELKKFSVTFNAGAHGLVQDVSGTPTNSITQQVKWGTSSTVVSAVANEHYHFLNWSNTAGDIVSTVAGLQAIGVTQDLVFTANFEIDKFTVTFVSGTFGGIEVAGAPPQYYEDKYTEIVEWGGSSKWVTAKPDDQNQFRGWHGDYTSDDLAIQVTNVQQDMTVTYDTVPDISGCSTDVTAGYSGGFQATDFKRVNIDVDTVTGHMVLNTGNQSIDPNSIIIPFTQDVYVTFLYEGAGFTQSDFGYKFASEGKNGTKHQIYANINDNDNDGVLDGVGDRNLDGVVDRQDNKVFLGTIEGGTEIVFYLDSTDNGCGGWCGDIFYTKREWNDHDAHARCAGTTAGISRLVKLYDNASEGDTTCYGYVPACGTGVRQQGWLNSVARTRLNTDFGFNFRAPVVGDPVGFNTKCIDELNGTPSTHAIVGAPDETPFAWVIGFDDTTMDNPSKSNDYDYNDVVFLVERKTGGMAQLELANAIVPNEANAYFTAVTFDVWDYLPSGGECAGKTHATYYVSAEGGSAGSWIEITAWDKINVSDISKTIGDQIDPAAWTPGTPEYTYRSRRIDLAGLGRTGNQLLWKAELVSEDEDCAPEIVDVKLAADTASHGFFARSSPVVQTNVIYAGTYETPSTAFPADERINRGHLTASLLYTPENPNQTLVDNTATADVDETLIWDAGEVLKDRSPDSRTIYFPDVTVTAEPDAILTDELGNEIIGDGVTKTFSGRFPHHPVVATTVRIHDSDDDESFTDQFTDDLKGSKTGKGTINRFTGEWTVTFTDPPNNNIKIMASYSHYTASSLLKEFNNANITTDILALKNQIINTRYIHDFNGDNSFGESDADWLVQWIRGYKQPNTSTQKAWKLGPIDHSTPALLVPPGYPLWYFGSQVTKVERNKYKEFKDAMEERDSVLFVGSRDGMLHAFDAGKYRYGDNPETAGVEENRGYFKWEEKPSPAPDYCASYAGNCPNYGTGEELWAFIPANLLPRLKNNLLKADDQAFVDASPALADVYIDYSPKDGTADTWRTVLLSAEGNGGDTVFCLDVTDPQNPTFMWEFAAPELFRSRSSPAVAQIGRIRDPNGTDAVKWVAFFVTGKVENANLFPSIYMIDIGDGSVLRRVVLDAAVDLDGSGTMEGAEIDYGRGGVPSGQPAIVDSDENGYIDRLYVATDKGLMYKVNIPDNPKNPAPWDISHCVLNTDFTDKDGNTIPSDRRLHPIYASPAIVVDNQITSGGDIAYKIMVLFGTGDNPYYDENINTADTRYHFFAYVDTNEKGACDPDKNKLDWFIELPAGNRIWASAFAAAGQIYFGTSTAETEDPCEGHLSPDGNEGRIYAVTLEGVILLNRVVGDVLTSPLVEDEHLYFRTPTGLQSLGSGIYNNEVQAAGEPTINIRSWREIIN
jgi:type IV pilus assembly protein PilY1